MKTLPSVDQARAAMLARVRPLAPVPTPLIQADGRTLAQAVTATRDQPPFDASAMDGWAVRADDLSCGSADLIADGESAAGRGDDRPLAPGHARRIFTGAPLPPGADRVVIQEEAVRDGASGRVRLSPSGASSHVRARGCDFRDGQTLLQAGTRLNPWRIALAAAAGRATLACAPAPRVAILATGDELVEPGQAAGPHQIYNSGVPSLSAFVARHGGLGAPLAIAGDSEQATAGAVEAAAFDVLVTIGGASVGDHDRVKPALRALGAVVHVEGCAMRPGKPVWFAVLPDGRPVLGLPGNPASALVCAELFLGPILAVIQGAEPDDRFGQARLAAPLAANGPRDHYIRARSQPGPEGTRLVTPFADQDSSLVSVMAAADILIRRPPHAPAADPGDLVQVFGPSL